MRSTLVVLCLASTAVAQDRYWGSYSSSYPAGGGGDSGGVAEARAVRERGQFTFSGASAAPRATSRATPRAHAAPSPPVAPARPRVAEASTFTTDVEPGQYVHNPEWDLTPYQLWKRRQAAKGQSVASTNSLPAARTKDLPAPRKMITVRKQKPQRQQAYIQPAAQQQPAQQRFQNFRPVEQQRSAPAPRTRQQQPTFQQKSRQQAYIQPAPRQPVQPAYQQPAYQQPQQPAYQPQQPAYQPQPQQQTYQQPQQLAAYPRAQHQTYTPEYIFEANNNAVRAYSYDAGLYSVQAAGGTTSYTAVY